MLDTPDAWPRDSCTQVAGDFPLKVLRLHAVLAGKDGQDFVSQIFLCGVTVISGANPSLLPVYQGVFGATSLSPGIFLALRCH